MNERINLPDLAVHLAEKADITKKEAEIFLQEYFEIIREALIRDELLKIKDLGVFRLSRVEDRESIDVTTGKIVLIPAHHTVVFSPDKKLAETVNEPFAFFETAEIEEYSVLEGLKMLPKEDTQEESEPTLDEEEIRREEESEEGEASEENEAFAEDEESEENEAYEEENEEESEDQRDESVYNKAPTFVSESLFQRKLESYCLHCQYYKAYQNSQEDKYQNEKKLNVLRINIGILAALLAVALGYILYLSPLDGSVHSKNASRPVVIPKSDTVPGITKKSTDSISQMAPPVKNEESEKTVAPATGGVSKQVIIAPGQMLTTIAQNEYGNRAFWIYIYLENKEIIRNPNVLPVGAKISIPPAEKYGIKSNDSASIQRAKELIIKNS